MIHQFLVPANLAFLEPALFAIRLARFFRAKIQFLHVLPSSPLISRFSFPIGESGRKANQFTPEERSRIEWKVAAFESSLPLATIQHRWKLAKGGLLPEILRAADSLSPDWIIQGSGRLSGPGEWIPGGTSWRTVQQAPCPVITVRHPAGLPPHLPDPVEPDRDGVEPPPGLTAAEPPPFREILYLIGSGESAATALPAAAALAKRSGACLTLLHVVDPNRRERPGNGRNPGEDPARRLRQLTEKAQVLQNGLNVSSSLITGEREEAVLTRIHQDRPDIVVMGTASGDSIGLLPAGLFWERILQRTGCPVMTVNRKPAGLEERSRLLLKKLTPRDLVRESGEAPEPAGGDLFSGLREAQVSSLFLRHYSVGGLTRLFEEAGLFARLRNRGFDEPAIAVQIEDPYRQRLRVHFGQVEDQGHTLIEMILREGILAAPRTGKRAHRDPDFQVLIVEWLAMQNPTIPFSADRPPLPGQRHPGLGISREILDLIALIGMQIGKDGVSLHPRYFHAAVLYRRLCKCYDPVQEGQLAALIRDTEEFNLNDASWAVALGCIESPSLTGEETWKIDDQLLPLTPRMRDHFNAEEYRTLFWSSFAGHHYRLLGRRLRKRLQERTPADDGGV